MDEDENKLLREALDEFKLKMKLANKKLKTDLDNLFKWAIKDAEQKSKIIEQKLLENEIDELE